MHAHPFFPPHVKHNLAVDYIGGLKQREVDMEKEIDALRREVASLKQGRRYGFCKNKFIRVVN